MKSQSGIKSKCWIALTASVLAVLSAPAANIVWVSDANDPAVGFFPPGGTNYSDSAFVTLLQNAGHNVIRYNQPNGQATLLTEAEIAALNTNDLVIISRTVNSGAFQQGQGDQWNIRITAPTIDMSPFHVRTGSNRLGWFAGAEGPDDTPTVLTAILTGNPATDAVIDYLFGGVEMNGTNTLRPYDEFLDRNTSQIGGAPAAGATIYATATYFPDGTVTPSTGNVIVGFPAGTAVRFGTNILAGYRMFFSAGSRESATAPANNTALYSGRETLSPAGENIYLRAVEVAIRSGVAPATDPLTPIGFTTQPASATILQNFPVTFSVAVTGAAPRSIQWQRDIGDGVTFTNIPGASTVFFASSIIITNVSLSDHDAKFRVEATNAQGTVLSSVATLTVTQDTAAPVPLSTATLDGMTLAVCFNELLDNNPDTKTAEDNFNYTIDGVSGPLVNTATLRADGKSVLLTLAGPVGPTYTLTVINVRDRWSNGIVSVDLVGTNHALTTAAVGTLNPVGNTYSCNANTFEITGGGLDLQNAADQFEFLYRTVDGDFDARVRVVSLVSANAAQSLEATAKAILTARATADTGSPAVNIYSTGPYPADNSVLMTYRSTAGGGTTTNGPAFTQGSLPYWLRIKRAGNTFTTYRSPDGATWTEMGSTTATSFGSSALVGLGALSRRNGRFGTATFSDFRILQAPNAPQLVNSSYSSGTFSASFQTQNGFSYEVQFTTTLTPPAWNTLTTIPGDGTVKPFTDSAAGQSRFYRVIAR